jgi:hypothetical protein
MGARTTRSRHAKLSSNHSVPCFVNCFNAYFHYFCLSNLGTWPLAVRSAPKGRDGKTATPAEVGSGSARAWAGCFCQFDDELR